MAGVSAAPSWLSQLGGLRRTPHDEFHDQCFYSARDIGSFRLDLLRQARANGYCQGRHPHWLFVRERLVGCTVACMNTLRNIQLARPTPEDRAAKGEEAEAGQPNKRGVHFSLEDTRRIAAQQLRLTLRRLVMLVNQPIQNKTLIHAVQAEANRLQAELESLMHRQQRRARARTLAPASPRQTASSPSRKAPSPKVHVSSPRRATVRASPGKTQIVVPRTHSLASPKRRGSLLSLQGPASPSRGSPSRSSPNRLRPPLSSPTPSGTARRSPRSSQKKRKPGSCRRLVASPSPSASPLASGASANASPREGAAAATAGPARRLGPQGKTSPRKLDLSDSQLQKQERLKGQHRFSSPLRELNGNPSKPGSGKASAAATKADSKTTTGHTATARDENSKVWAASWI